MIRHLRAIFLLLYLLLSHFLSYSKVDTVKLQLKWKHQFQFAGYYAAHIKGYYQEENLHVDIKPYVYGQDIVKDVVNNSAQYGVYGCDLLIDYDRGEPVTVLACIFQHSPYVVLSPKEKKITKPTDLSGKRIMAGRGIETITLQTLLKDEGVPLDSVTLLPFDKELLFSNNKLDALIAYKTSTTIELTRAGFQLSVIQPSDYGVDFYGDVLFTSANEISKHPDRAESFRRASLKGWEYALENPEEIADYILGLPGVKERRIDKEFLLAEAEEIKSLMRPNLVEIGHMNKGRWGVIYRNYKELGRVKDEVDLQNFVYSTDAIEKSKRRILIFIISLLAFLAFLFFLINIVSRRSLKLKDEKLKQVYTKSQFNEESIQIILEYAGIIIWHWDVGNHTFSIYGDETSSHIRNIEDFKSLIHRKTLDQFELFLDLLPSDFSQEVFMRIDGNYQWRLLTIKARSYVNGRPASYMGMLIDISDIKNKQTRLETLSTELQKSNIELEKFAYITSHNLRAPIVNLEGLISFYSYNPAEIESNHDIVNKMNISVKRLKDTLDDLIEVVSNKSKINVTQNIAVNNELYFLIHKLGISRLVESDVEVRIDIPNEYNILSSKKVFHTIFEHLITNSLKFRKPDVRLKICFSAFDNEDYNIIEISDNGVGIDLVKNGDKIFGLYQKFHQGINGKGLGLFIVKSQIESLDGKIELDSKVQEGTTFRLYFRKQA